jgi:3-oxoacyl-[acyl-carrier-protein] synthase-3
MSVIAGMMKSFGIQKGLLLVGDTITKIISKKDNSLRPIFSDAGSASAFILNEDAPKMTFRFGSRGKDFEAIHIPHGGYRFPTSESSLKEQELEKGVIRNQNQLSMNGQAVFTFGLSTVAKSIKNTLEATNTSATEIDFVVLHQANQLLNDSIVRKTGFSPKQAPSSLYEHGNTSCATIPVTLVANLNEQLRSGKINLLLTGFGVGLSWGNVILETDQLVCPELILV